MICKANLTGNEIQPYFNNVKVSIDMYGIKYIMS